MLTSNVQQIKEHLYDDVEELLEHGFSEELIVEAVTSIAHEVYSQRLALEQEHKEAY